MNFAKCLVFLAVLASSCLAAPLLNQYGTQRDVRSIIADGAYLWLGTSGGIVKFPQGGGTPVTYSSPTDLRDMNITALVRTSDGFLWSGSADGYLVRMDPSRERFECYNSLHYTGWDVRCITPYKGYLLVGSRSGLSFFSPASGSVLTNAKTFGTFTDPAVIAVVTYRDTIAVVLPQGIARAACADPRSVNFNDATVWSVQPATGVGGLIVTDTGLATSPYRVQVSAGVTYELTNDGRVIRNGQVVASGLGAAVNCVAEVSGAFYAGTEGAHLWKVTGSGDITQRVLNSPASSDIRSCALDGQGVLWYVTADIGEGVGRLQDDVWHVITAQSDSAPGFGSTAISRTGSSNQIMAARGGDVWVGSCDHGFKWLQRSSGRWTCFMDSYGCAVLGMDCAPSPMARFDADTNAWWTFGSAVCQDSLGYLWLGNERAYTSNVLHVFDPVATRWNSFSADTFNLPGKPGTYVRSLSAGHDRRNGAYYVVAGIHEAEVTLGFGVAVLLYPDAAAPFTPGRVTVTSLGTSTSINGVAVANDSLVWLVASDGLYRMRYYSTSSLRKMETVEVTSPLLALTMSPTGYPVFANNGDLYEYQDSVNGEAAKLVNLTGSGLLGAVNGIIYDAPRASYWLATSSGLMRFRTGEYLAPTVTSYGEVLVYPNPLSLSKGSREVVFERLPAKSQVIIYDVAGNMVWRSGASPDEVQGRTGQVVRWDGRNSSDRQVLPGTYFYHIFSGSKRTRGKLLVVP
jgi:ligand-binding sensor domain-containing protein